jgi:transposase
VRVTTAFKRLLGLPGASVIDVSFGAEGVIVTVRLRRRRRVCSRCGQTGQHLQIHDRRLKRWRHLDLGRTRCVIECELRRLRCRHCGVHLEAVPWARPGAHHTRDFEDVVAWLAQQMAKTQIAGLLRIAWDTVGQIVEHVISERLDERRLEGLVQIGVDEISYRRHHRYLTSVVDHHGGGIVWCSPGRNSETLQGFFELLGERRHSIKAVSIDMSGGYEKAIRQALPRADVCFDPFHVVRLAQRAVDQVRRDEWNAHERSHTAKGRWIKGTRWSLLKAPTKQKPEQLALLAEVQQANKALYRAFLLKEELRLLYQLEPSTLAEKHLDAWLDWASRSRLEPFVKLARTIRLHRTR